MEFKKNTFIAAVSACAIAGLVGVAAWGLSMPGAGVSSTSEVQMSASSSVVSSSAAVSQSSSKAASSSSSKAKKANSSSSSSTKQEEKNTSSSSAGPKKEEAPEEKKQEETTAQQEEQHQSTESAVEPEAPTNTETPACIEKDDNSKPVPAEKSAKPSKEQGTTDQSKVDSKSDSAPEPEPEPEPARVWVEPVYETVNHPEEGHWETVVIGTNYYCLCGEQVDSPDGWAQHRADFIASNGGKCNGQHVSYSEEDITEEQWVVDSPAWSEQVLVSEGHWE